jgi:small subunit ribosomal protein S1
MAVDNIQPPQKTSDNSENNQIISMADLLAQEDLTFPVIKMGEIVKGVVAKKSSSEIFVDIGAKSEGVVDSKDLGKLTQEELSQINIGDTVFVYILNTGTDDEDRAELSLSQAKAEQDWDFAQRLFKTGESVERPVVGYNKGGLIVEFGQLRGFVPGSQVVTGQSGGVGKSTGRWNQMVGKTLSLKIIEVDKERNRLILSERLVMDEAREKDNEKKSEFLHTLTEGQTVTGRITRLVEFGAFVDVGGGIDGLIHLSELAWARILHPNEILSVGDEVQVYVLNVDIEQQRVALSLKRLQPEPWSKVFEHYQINQVVDAVITKLTDFGAFARIDDRIEGLIHISEISNKNITHPNQMVTEGDKIQVRIINIDPERRRMGLSIKQVDETPADWDMPKQAEVALAMAEAMPEAVM